MTRNIVNGRGQQVGRQQVIPIFEDGPLAQPAVLTYKNPEGAIELLTIGGLTKAEALAGQICAGMGFGCSRDIQHEYAISALDMAESILAESQRRQIQRAKEQAALNAHGRE